MTDDVTALKWQKCTFHKNIYQYPNFCFLPFNATRDSTCTQTPTFWKLYIPPLISGAIIGDEHRKRAPFLVLGLAPWYGIIFVFLEQIAPSPAAHARTCCEDFLRISRRENGVRNSQNLLLLALYSTRLCLLEFCLSIFVVSCSSFSEERQCRI